MKLVARAGKSPEPQPLEAVVCVQVREAHFNTLPFVSRAATARSRMAEVEAEHALAATVDAAELCSVAEPDHFVSETTLLADEQICPINFFPSYWLQGAGA